MPFPPRSLKRVRVFSSLLKFLFIASLRFLSACRAVVSRTDWSQGGCETRHKLYPECTAAVVLFVRLTGRREGGKEGGSSHTERSNWNLHPNNRYSKKRQQHLGGETVQCSVTRSSSSQPHSSSSRSHTVQFLTVGSLHKVLQIHRGAFKTMLND